LLVDLGAAFLEAREFLVESGCVEKEQPAQRVQLASRCAVVKDVVEAFHSIRSSQERTVSMHLRRSRCGETDSNVLE